MPSSFAFLAFLLRLYIPIGTSVVFGVLLSWGLSQLGRKYRGQSVWSHRVAGYLGQFLFWIGVPLSIFSFLRRTDLGGSIWLSPVVAWVAILLGLGLAWWWLQGKSGWSQPSQGSFLLSCMVGNTGYIGYPVILLLPQLGPEYFGWALFYDILGTFFGAYGLGVILASHFSPRHLHPSAHSRNWWTILWQDLILELGKNPILLAFFLGLACHSLAFPPLLDQLLNQFAWSMVVFSLVLMGMRLQQVTSARHLPAAMISVGIKMLGVPLTIGILLTVWGLEGPPKLVLILQSGMPSAFATLILAEHYQLDRELTATVVGLGSAFLVITLPVWVLLFSGGI